MAILKQEIKLRSVMRSSVVLLMDIFIINASFFLSFLLQYSGNFFSVDMADIYWRLILPVNLIRLVCFYSLGLNDWAFRFASFSEAIRLVFAVLLGSLMIISFSAFAFMKRFAPDIGRTIFVIDFLLCVFLMGLSRFSFRFLLRIKHEFPFNQQGNEISRVLIVGAGSSGDAIAREILYAEKPMFQVIGFIDDDPSKRNVHIHGFKVLGTVSEIQTIAPKYKIKEIIIAIPSAKGAVMREIIRKCECASVKIKTLPRMQDILTGHVGLKAIRDVQPEDLLGREIVSINGTEIKGLVENKVILITGAGGSIGAELSRKLAIYNPKLLILFDVAENDVYFLKLELERDFPGVSAKILIGDVKDISVLKHIFSNYYPNIVFHAAAHKHLPLMEDNPAAAVKNNIMGSRNLIYAAHHYKTERFVLISTDKAVNPSSVMGASKRIAEMFMQAKAKQSATKFMAVRFGNVLGSNGSVVQIFKKQIEKGGPITVTHPDVRRYFMTAGEAAQLVIQAAAMGIGGEIFVLDMGEQIKIIDLARNLITLSGLEIDEDIQIKVTGLRPAEKLYEEVLHDAEQDLATRHEKIFVTSNNWEKGIKNMKLDLKELERLANLMDYDGILKKMSRITSNYKYHEISTPKCLKN